MSWIISDYFTSAYQSLKRSRMRTFLTTLGVAIGVGSVTAILALGGGLTDVINNQLDKLGGNLIVVRPGAGNIITDLTAPANQQNYVTSTLSEADVESIKALPDVQAAAPIMTQNATLKTDIRTLPNAVVVSTTPEFIDISKLTVHDGQFLDNETNDHTAVIGRQLAVNLFGTEKPIGLTFTIRGERFTVVGILKPAMDPVNYNRIDFDNAAMVGFGMGKALNQGRVQIQQIDVRAKNLESINSLNSAINKTLLKNHSEEQDFHVISGESIGTSTSDLMRALTGVMAAIAACWMSSEINMPAFQVAT